MYEQMCLLHYYLLEAQNTKSYMVTVPWPSLQSGPSSPHPQISPTWIPTLPSGWPVGQGPWPNTALISRHQPWFPICHPAIRVYQPGGRDQEADHSHLLTGCTPTMGLPLCEGWLAGWGPWPGAARMPRHPLQFPVCCPAGQGKRPRGGQCTS